MSWRGAHSGRGAGLAVYGLGCVSILGLLASPVVASAQVEELHASLAEVHLLESDAPPLQAPSHVKVVEKGGRLALEGATSVVEASLALGAWNAGHGKPDEGIKVVEAGLKESSDDPDLLSMAAALALELREPERTLEFVARGLKRNPRHARLHFEHGRALAALGRHEESLAALNQAASLSPDNGFYQSSLGRAAYESGQYELAVRAFRAARSALRHAHEPVGNLAVALLASGDLEASLATSLEVQPQPVPERGVPNAAVAFANRGAIFLRKHAWEDAERSYQAALALDPDVPGASYNYGYLLYRRGERQAARQHYEQALSHRADRPLAHLHLAEMDLARGDAASAARRIESARAYFDAELLPRALVLRGDSLKALREFPASAEAYREALARRPGDVATEAALAAALRLSGDLAGARALITDARARSPRDKILLLELAAIARAEGDAAAEKASYLEILANEGETDETWLVQLNLALLLLREGETAEARVRLEPLVSRASVSTDSDGSFTSAEARVLATTYGMLLAKEGGFTEAAARFEEVERASAGFGPALQGLGVVAALEGDLEAARRRLSAVTNETSDTSALAAGNLGLVLWLSMRDDEARPLLERARDAYPGWASVRAALASASLRAGQFTEAVSEASEARRLCERAPRENPFSQSLPQNWLGVTLGGDDALCERVDRMLGSALVGTSVVALGQASLQTSFVQSSIDRAMALPLGSVDEARARFVRGTLSLLGGADGAARDDLAAALAGELDAALRPYAENNLGVALHRLGDVVSAERHFQNARSASGGTPAATLNLGVVLDDRNENAEALRLYEAYLASGASARGSEVRDWIENLRRVEQ